MRNMPGFIVNRLRRFLPTRRELSWGSLVWLIYLGFLVMPWVGHDEQRSRAFWPTLISVLLFLAIYLRRNRTWPVDGAKEPSAGYTDAVLSAFLCYLVTPVNTWALTYMSYAGWFAAAASLRIVPQLLLMATLLAIYAAEIVLLGYPTTLIAVTFTVAIAVCLANFVVIDNRRKNAALKLSQEEIHRLATVAERERIGRDLHDLLGHTLSLIAIKSELAGKLLERNREEAAREVAEVTSIARDALRQVRAAVTGIGSAALEAELASATMLLNSSGIHVACHRDATALSPRTETALAMIVREATTNIHRHSGASRASIEVCMRTENVGGSERATVLLLVSDNGRGGVVERGNGLTGINERVRSLGGTLEIESERGQGTTLRARVPVESLASRISRAVTNVPETAEVLASRASSDTSGHTKPHMPGGQAAPT